MADFDAAVALSTVAGRVFLVREATGFLKDLPRRSGVVKLLGGDATTVKVTTNRPVSAAT